MSDRRNATPLTTLPPSVVHILPDKLGGVVSTAANLLRFRPVDALPQGVIFTHNRLESDTRFGREIGADWQRTVELALPLENVRAVLARLARALPDGPGVLVANDWVELAMLSVYDVGRTVVQVVHGDYEFYYDLATRHDAIVDVYVGCSERIAERLRERLPHRAESIFHLRHGVEISGRVRTATNGPLRLLFIGRLAPGKGVHDLPQIDRELTRRGVDVRWTIVGDGPERDALRVAWPASDRVYHAGSVAKDAIVRIAASHDLFVLPTRAEGLPLVVLEAMAAGLVPIVSDLPSGIPELVLPGDTGFRPAIGDIAAFADAIARLAADPPLLERMSAASRSLIVRGFDIRDCARAYHELFARWEELRRPRGTARLHYGSRLDRAWLPNALVYALRSLTKRR